MKLNVKDFVMPAFQPFYGAVFNEKLSANRCYISWFFIWGKGSLIAFKVKSTNYCLVSRSAQ